jgi:hypothetical protein
LLVSILQRRLPKTNIVDAAELLTAPIPEGKPVAIAAAQIGSAAGVALPPGITKRCKLGPKWIGR